MSLNTRALELLLLSCSMAGCAGSPTGGPTGEPTAESASPSPEEIEEPPAATEANNLPGYRLREGRYLYDHYCTHCHGVSGAGDGFNAYNLDPRPRNFSDAEFQGQRSDPDLAEIVRLGGGAAGLSSGMPPWGRTLNERQIANLVLYLRTLVQDAPEG